MKSLQSQETTPSIIRGYGPITLTNVKNSYL